MRTYTDTYAAVTVVVRELIDNERIIKQYKTHRSSWWIKQFCRARAGKFIDESSAPCTMEALRDESE
jgi:hypothetical protein